MKLENRSEYVVRLLLRDEQGREIGETEAIRYAGLLHLAHEDALTSVRTELVQIPSDANEQTAIVRATVRTRRGTFSGYGDANIANVSARVAGAIVRVAETRAIGRAFRTAVDVGAVCLEELDESAQATTPAGPVPLDPVEVAIPSHHSGRDLQPEVAEAGDKRPISEAQRKYLFRLAYQLGETRDGATSRVLAVLGVDRFEAATRTMAARAIDKLKQESSGGSQKADDHANGSGHG
jgi:hypothetical protein